MAPSSFLHQDYSKDKKGQNRFSSATTVGCSKLSLLDSAPPIGEVFIGEPLPLALLEASGWVMEKHILL